MVRNTRRKKCIRSLNNILKLKVITDLPCGDADCGDIFIYNTESNAEHILEKCKENIPVTKPKNK